MSVEIFKRVFGDEITVAGFSVYGVLTIPQSKEVAFDIVQAIGMTCSHEPHVTIYKPDKNGISPGFIVQQCIIESFVTLDVWPPRKGCYIHIASCKDFHPSAIYPVFIKHHLQVRGVMGGYLSL